ncbi:MAG: hypothetical protein JKY43_00145 [Phycisphaerales bacterium]|nr:hypothetical protein [Phycisphaerales bacterium]
MSKPSPLILLLMLLMPMILLIAIPSCTHPVNARLELGTLSPTPTFVHSPKLTPLNSSQKPSKPRSLWNTTIIIAPIDGIAHNPTLRLYPVLRNNDHPRTYGLLPTTDSALKHQTHSPIASLRYTRSELTATITSIIDPFLIHHHLTNTHWSPRRVWKRTRQDNTWSSGQPANQSQDTQK